MDDVAGGSVVWKLDGDVSGLTSSLNTAKSEISSFSTLTQSAERDTTSSFGAIASSADSGLGSTSDSAKAASDSVTGLTTTTKESADETDSATAAIGNSFDSAARRIIAYGGLTTIIYKVSEAVTGSISSFADFDSDLGVLQTVTGATSSQMTALSSTAIQLGNDISLPGVSASGAATAELELAKAGLSVNDVLGASKGVLSLATAGQIDVGAAADITAEALNSFGLAGSQATTVADELAAGADASTASVSDMALGLEQVGAGAHQLHISLSDTITSLSLFSNAGIDGERAGTDLNQMFQQMAAPTKEASDEMKALGLNFFDAQGNFIGLSSVAQELQDKFKGLTVEQQNAALAIIFGSSATRTAAVLANNGAAGFSAMTAAVDKQGAAANLAAAANNGIKGSLSALQSNLQTTELQLGKFISAGLKPIIDLANSNIPAALTATGAALLGVATVIAYIMNPALFTMEGALGGIQVALDALGIGLIIAGISALAAGIVILQQRTDFLGKSFSALGQLLSPIYTIFERDLLPIFRQIATFVGGQLTIVWNNLTKSVHALSTALAPYKPQLEDLAKVLGIALLVPIVLVTAGIAAFTLVLITAITVVARIIGWVAEAVAAFVQFGVAVAQSVDSAIRSVVGDGEQIIDWFTRLPGAIVGAVGNLAGLLVSAGTEVISGLVNGITGAASGVYTAIKNASDQIGKFFTGAASWLYDVGRAIVQGLIDGIEGMVKDVTDAAGKIGDAVQNKVKSLLGIHSPSTVFHDIGVNVGQGLINGVTSMQDAASSAMSKLIPAGGTLNLDANLNTSAGTSIAKGLDNRLAAVQQPSGPIVNIHLNQSGIVATSRSAFRNIMKDGISAVNEELRARRLPQIADGKLSGSSTA